MTVAEWIKPVTHMLDAIYTTDVTVWYLRRTAPPAPLSTLPPLRFSVETDRKPSAKLYRDLYTRVGAPWLWWEMRSYSDRQLEERFDDGERLLLVPRDEAGNAIGMVELDWPSQFVAEIRYFGLVPSAVGQGLGKQLMAVAINHAWRSGVREVQLNTCSLDHPAAMGFYQANGFVVTNEQKGALQIPHRHIDRELLKHIKKTGSHQDERS